MCDILLIFIGVLTFLNRNGEGVNVTENRGEEMGRQKRVNWGQDVKQIH